MKLSIIATLLSLHQTTSFTTHQPQQNRRTTALSHHDEIDPSRIKKAGAGIATKPPGNNCSFDPNENGKLQGTGNCDERVGKGAGYGASAAAVAATAVPSNVGVSPPSRAPTSNLTSLISGKSQY